MGEVVEDVGKYRVKEMATNWLEEVLEAAVEVSKINSMVRLIMEYGPETRNTLETELRNQRMEEDDLEGGGERIKIRMCKNEERGLEKGILLHAG